MKRAGDIEARVPGPPPVPRLEALPELPPFTPGELRAMLREGCPELEDAERGLAWAARASGAVDVALGEGLDLLRRGDRLAALACHLDDYGREVLELGRSAALDLARLGRELRTRPLLRRALVTGRVQLRAAQTVLAVAVGEREAEWVERAERLTVRELERAVRRETGKAAAGDDEEEWLRLDVHVEPGDRAVVDEALALAGEAMPGSGRTERLEALAQEFLAEHYVDPDADEQRRLWPTFRPAGPGKRARRAALEEETERWCVLPEPAGWSVPEVVFDESMSAPEVDARLKELAVLREGWDRLVGYLAYVVKESRLWEVLGFADFRHYVEERLKIPARAVEQRAALEGRIQASPALQEARRQKVSFEKLRLLSRLAERDVGPWTARAKALTCVDLRRALEREKDRQMRGLRRLRAPVPRRIAVVLAAAVAAVRERCGRYLAAGKCLAVVAWHFLETWKGLLRPRRTRSREVRERDGHCQVPGCSRRASHAHHVDYRSHGGGDEPENLVGLCGFHHLRCVHGGWLRVFGRAPDALTWILRGEVWTGPRSALAGA